MGNVVEWGGDLKLSRCLAKAKGVPLPDGGLTVDERIHQMEVGVPCLFVRRVGPGI